jgi:hypothetical protein
LERYKTKKYFMGTRHERSSIFIFNVAEKVDMRPSMGTAWGVSKTWIPPHEVNKRVRESLKRTKIRNEEKQKPKSTFDSIFDVSKRTVRVKKDK